MKEWEQNLTVLVPHFPFPVSVSSARAPNKHLIKRVADLYSSRTPKRRKMLISVRLLRRYVIIIYALGLVHEKVGV